MKCSCGSSLSISISTAPPSRIDRPITLPAAQGLPPARFWALAASRPGMISEKAQAANITPAPKPNSVSCTRSDRRCENITGTVPSAVATAATEPPRKAFHTTGRAVT